MSRRGEQFGRQRLLEPEQYLRGLDLDALARIELDLGRTLGLAHQAAGVELACIFEQCVHRGRIVA
jgi:hypothetical protein